MLTWLSPRLTMNNVVSQNRLFYKLSLFDIANKRRNCRKPSSRYKISYSSKEKSFQTPVKKSMLVYLWYIAHHIYLTIQEGWTQYSIEMSYFSISQLEHSLEYDITAQLIDLSFLKDKVNAQLIDTALVFCSSI